MTDEQAIAILRDAGAGYAWIDWTDDRPGRPAWRNGTIILDGHFTPDDLRALLHFAPVAEG